MSIFQNRQRGCSDHIIRKAHSKIEEQYALDSGLAATLSNDTYIIFESKVEMSWALWIRFSIWIEMAKKTGHADTTFSTQLAVGRYESRRGVNMKILKTNRIIQDWLKVTMQACPYEIILLPFSKNIIWWFKKHFEDWRNILFEKMRKLI